MNPIRRAYFPSDSVLCLEYVNGNGETLIRNSELGGILQVYRLEQARLGRFQVSVYWTNRAVFCSTDQNTYSIQIHSMASTANHVSGVHDIVRGSSLPQQGSLLREFQSRTKIKLNLPEWW